MERESYVMSEDVNNSNPLEQYLPGEQGKFKTIEDLARAKYESDNFIDQIKTENSELRNQLKELETQMNKAKGVDDVLMALKSMSAGNAGVRVDGGDNYRSDDGYRNQPAADHGDSETRVKELVQQMLEQRETFAKQESNWSTVQSKFLAKHGNDPELALVGMKATARELGMAFEDFQRSARANPNLVLRAAGLAQQSGGGTDGGVRFSGASTGDRADTSTGGVLKTEDYYAKLREDLKARGKLSEYYSPRIQNEIMKSAETLGEKFFTRTKTNATYVS